jgi:hypothetical protein
MQKIQESFLDGIVDFLVKYVIRNIYPLQRVHEEFLFPAGGFVVVVFELSNGLRAEWDGSNNSIVTTIGFV